MIKYADYAYYKHEYGGELDRKTFTKNAIRASAYIRSIVNGKLETDDYDIDDYEEVKYAVCELCDVIEDVTSSSSSENGMLVNSVSNDGYSVSYASPQNGATVEDVIKDKAKDIAKRYLAETGLLSRCVY